MEKSKRDDKKQVDSASQRSVREKPEVRHLTMEEIEALRQSLRDALATVKRIKK